VGRHDSAYPRAGLLFASAERDLERGRREQDRVTAANGALSATPPHARCSLRLAAYPVPDDSGDVRSARSVAARCEKSAIMTLGGTQPADIPRVRRVGARG
jgi:hypothetical protein